jgi:hypothetical protein
MRKYIDNIGEPGVVGCLKPAQIFDAVAVYRNIEYLDQALIRADGASENTIPENQTDAGKTVFLSRQFSATPNVVDDSIDWRYRYVTIWGSLFFDGRLITGQGQSEDGANSVANPKDTHLAAHEGTRQVDNKNLIWLGIEQYQTDAESTPCWLFFYSGPGGDGFLTFLGSFAGVTNSAGDDMPILVFYADDVTGSLMAKMLEDTASSGGQYVLQGGIACGRKLQ